MRSTARLVLVLAALLAASCGGHARSASPPEWTPDARFLLLQVADLPEGFSVVPGETLPTPLAVILGDPWWTASEKVFIRRERVAGYQTAFWSPERRRIDCQVAVYRSSAAAGRVFREGQDAFERFLRAAGDAGPMPPPPFGDERRAHRYEIAGMAGFGVTWRDGNVLASCVAQGSRPPDRDQLLLVARLQEQRIARGGEPRPG